MSMLQAQVDELRAMAESVGLATPRAATLMMDAADTIWQLRDDLQRTNADNAKLRERIHELEMEGSDHFYCTAYAEDANRTLEAENEKLRELLQMALTSHDKMCTNRGTCSGCLFFKAKPFAPACPMVSVTRDARELGVEVPDGD